MKKLSLLSTLLFLSLVLTGFTPVKEYSIPATEDVVMYQINPRNFAPEDSFNEVYKHIDRIAGLGVNVVWFMPICETGVLKAKSSPYCVKNYTAVNPEFGTVDDFKRLVDGFHRRGITVIIDWVANHTSWDNQWITDHPEWYTHNDAGEIISPEGTGWDDVADLNFDDKNMREAMIGAMKFWVEKIGIDGFRCDAADYVPYDFWKQCVDDLRSIKNRDLLLLAEGQRKDHFEAGFDMNYAWGWLSTLRKVYTGETVPPEQNQANAGNGRPRRNMTRQVPASRLFETDVEEYAGVQDGKVKLRFTTNHDEHQKMSPIREFFGQQGSMAAFVATSFIHGGMLIYGCQEVGYPGRINFFNYVDVDWNGQKQLYEEYRNLISIYNANSAVRKGRTVSYPDDNVLVFERKDSTETVLVVINMRDTQQSVSVPSSWNGKKATDLCSGKETALSEKVTLRPFEYMILK